MDLVLEAGSPRSCTQTFGATLGTLRGLMRLVLGVLKGAGDCSQLCCLVAKGKFWRMLQEQEGANCFSLFLSPNLPLVSLIGRSQMTKEKCVVQSSGPNIKKHIMEGLIGMRGKSSIKNMFTPFVFLH